MHNKTFNNVILIKRNSKKPVHCDKLVDSGIMTLSVLMVAEKPSICTSVANALCGKIFSNNGGWSSKFLIRLQAERCKLEGGRHQFMNLMAFSKGKRRFSGTLSRFS
jgi:hypothetical protein